MALAIEPDDAMHNDEFTFQLTVLWSVKRSKEFGEVGRPQVKWSTKKQKHIQPILWTRKGIIH